MARMRHFLKRCPAVLLSAALLAAAAGTAAAADTPAPTLGIYTTGDMGGRLYREDPVTGEAVEYSYQNVASAMEAERASVDAALLLDSGDAVDNGLVQDGGAAEALALRAIGYDALVPAVGEFRLGPEARDDFFAALGEASEDGAPVRVLSGNYLDEDTQSPEEDAYEVFTVELGRRAVRIGVLGLGAMEAPEALPDSFVEGVRFAHRDNTSGSYSWEWTGYWQERLEKENCDLVVVVCHAGQDELARFAAETTGIDLLVGGHGEAAAESLQNADGEPVSLVSGGGTSLTRTTITLSPKGEVVVGESTLLPLSDYEPDDRLNKALSAAQSAASDRMQAAVGTLSGDWSEEGSPLYVQSATVDLVAEAMLWAADADAALLSPAALGGASAASRFSGEDDTAVLSLRDCAALAPGDSPVVLVELTGAELRQWLDRSAEAYQAEPDGSISGGEGADVLYGMDYTLYLGASEGQRVDGLAFKGALVDDGQTFRVAVSADRLSAPDFPDCTPLWSAARDSRFAAQSGIPAAVLAGYLSEQTHLLGMLSPQRSSTWSLYTGSVNGPLNRLEFVTMLYEMAGKPKPGASAAFIDVSNSDAAVWAAETGVVSGNGTGKFLPTQTVTREQAAVMLYNYAKFLGLKTPSSGPSATALLDCGEIAVWARPAVEFCIRTGALSAAGLRGDLFLPRGTLTRGEANRCLAAFADYIEAN